MNLNNSFNQLRFQQYAEYLKSQGLSASTISRKLSSLSTFQKYLTKKNLVSASPNSSTAITNTPSPTSKTISSSNQPFFRYLFAVLLLLLFSGLGYGLYTQTILKAKKNLAYSTAASPVRAGRVISFQGRLTDSSGNAITSSTPILFELYTAGTGGTQLYTSNVGNSQTIVPDENGIFSVVIGRTHGTEIPSNVFSENPDIWLQIISAGETMTPRQEIATVGYAMNSETLQGLAPSASGFKNTVLVIDGSGNLNLGETSPTIISKSGTFGIIGQALLIGTSAGSGGNITINPDANGIIKLITSGVGSTAVGGQLELTNANLNTGNLIGGVINNNNRSYNFIQFSNYGVASTLVTRFAVDAYGNTTVGGTLATTSLSVATTALVTSLNADLLDGYHYNNLPYDNYQRWVANVGTSYNNINSGTTLSFSAGAGLSIAMVGNTLTFTNTGVGTTYTFTNGINNLTNVIGLGGTLTQNTLIGTSSFGLSFLGLGNSQALFVGTSGYVGIGTTNPANTLEVIGTADIKTVVNNTAAFQVLNSGGQPIFNVDTTNQTNLISNPGFEVNTTGWSSKLNATLTRNTSQHYLGVASLQIGTSAGIGSGTSMASFTQALSTGTSYTLSFYAKASAGNFNTLEAGFSPDGATQNACALNSTSVVSNGWRRFACTFLAGTISGTPYIYIDQTDATARTFYVDSAQLQASNFVTPYTIGAIQLRGVVNSPAAFQALSDSVSAFQIQNTAGNSNIFVVNTLDNAIGIGVSSPFAKLDLLNSTGTGLTLAAQFQNLNNAANNNGLYVNIAAGDTNSYIFNAASSNGTSRFIVRANGNVGIGTTAPKYLLDVNGVGNFTQLGVGGTGTAKFNIIGNGNISTSLQIGTSLNVTGNVTIGGTFISVGSTNLVTNLNANYLNGYASNALPYVNNTTDSTLTRSGTGPYTLGLNLGSTNTWTVFQAFGAGVGITGNLTVGGTFISVGSTNLVTNLNANYLGGIASNGYLLVGYTGFFNTALNGLQKIGSTAIGIGGTLIQNTTIGTSGYSLSFLGLSNNQSLFIGASGLVGIGTTNPLYNFHVLGDQFISGHSTIGLGTTNPLYALNVGGTANFVNLFTSSNLNIGGTLTIASGASNGYVLTSDASGNSRWSYNSAIGTTYAAGVGLTLNSSNVFTLNLGNTNTWLAGQIFNGNVTIGGTFISVGSTNLVTNLNANYLGGYAANALLYVNTAGVGLSLSGTGPYTLSLNLGATNTWLASQFFASNVGITGNLTIGGTFISVGSTNLVTNLNANYLGGYNAATFLQIGQTGSLPYVNNTTDTTLTRSGAGPYTLGLNLANANTWTGAQIFNGNVTIGATFISVGSTNLVTNLNANYLGGYSYNNLPYDNYQRWVANVGTSNANINSGSTLSFVGGTGVAISMIGGTITFNNTSVGTTYAAGVGLTLSNINVFALNLGNTNTWLASQFFASNVGITGNLTVGGTFISVGSTNLVTNLNANYLGGYAANALPYVNNTTDSTLTRSGVGPFTLGLNLGATNTWTVFQAFGAGVGITGNLTIGGTFISVGSTNLVTNLNANYLGGIASNGYLQVGGTGFFNTATNGLMAIGNTGVGLGGALTVGTSINLGAYNLGFYGAGYVGIGTTSPGAKLDINGNLNVGTSLTVGTNLLVGGTFVSVGSTNLVTNLNANYLNGYAYNNLPYFSSASNGLMAINANTVGFGGSLSVGTSINQGAYNLGFYGAGNFGIGTTSPLYKLTVTGDEFISGHSTIGLGTTNPLYALNVGGTANFVNSFFSGNVGIGLTNPVYNFQVQGDGFISSHLTVGLGATNSLYALNVGGTANFSTILATNAGSTAVVTGLNADLIDGYHANGLPYQAPLSFTNGLLNVGNTISFGGSLSVGTSLNQGAYNLGFYGAGNFGIGTTSPLYKFTVAGDEFISGHSTIGIGTTNPLYALNVGGTSSFTDVTASGRVGLGTATPAYRLDVSGDINLTGTIRAVGVTGSNGQVLSSNGAGGLTWLSTSGLGTTYNATNGLSINVGATNVFGLGGTLIQNTLIGTSSFNLSFLGLGGTIGLSQNSSGYVGIGTSNPGATLDIFNTTNPQLRLSYSPTIYSTIGTDNNGNLNISTPNAANSGIDIISGINTGNGNNEAFAVKTNQTLGVTDELFQIINNATQLLTILGNGNLGLGTTNPAYQLDTTGSIRVGGTFISVGSTNLVTNLNANYLSGYSYNNLPYVNNTTDSTLTRSGAGPYTLGINLANANTWTGNQTFNGNVTIGGTFISVGSTNIVTNLNANLLEGFHASQLNYGSWNLQTNGAGTTAIGSTATVNFIGGAGINIGQNGSAITISSTGTNFVAKNGLNLTGSDLGLGGTLSQATAIGTSSFSLSFLGLGNSQSLYISSTGNVGFGTTAPFSKTTTIGTESNVTFIRNVPVSGDGSTDVAITDSNTFSPADVGRIILWNDGTTNSIVGTNGTSPNAAYIDGNYNSGGSQTISIYNPNFSIGSSGQVGVGTVNLTDTFRVNGIMSASKYSAYSDSRFYLDPSNGTSYNTSLSLHGNGSITFNAYYNGSFLTPESNTASTRLKSFDNGFAIGINSGSHTAGVGITWNDQAFFVKDNGNIGIGTSDPQARLHIAAANSVITNTAGDITINSASGSLSLSSNQLINFSRTLAGSGSPFAPTYSFSSSTATGIYSPNNDMLSIATSGVDRLMVDNTGLINIGPVGTTLSSYGAIQSAIGTSAINLALNPNGGFVGIGTTNPGKNLEVAGTIRLSTGAANTDIFMTGNNLSIIPNNNGSVGIGTSNPSAPLGIVGNTIFRGTVHTNALFQTSIGGTNVDAALGISVLNGWLPTITAYSPTLGTGGGLVLNTVSSSTAQAIQLQIGSTERMRIDYNGNVGIGTTSPLNTLHVQGTNGGSAGIYFNNAAPATVTNTLYNNGGSLYWNGSPLASGGSISGLTNYIPKYTSASTLGTSLIIDTGTNVGVGVTAPGERFTIVDAGNSNLYNGTFGLYSQNLTRGIAMGYAGISATGSNPNSDLYLNAKGTGNIILQTNSTGNVGIGTTNPPAPLSIGDSGDLAYIQINTYSATNKRTRINFAQNGTNGMEIGTDLYSNNNNDLYIYNRVNTIVAADFNPGTSLFLSSRGTNSDFFMNSAGNVGIGTTAPLYKLDVGRTDALGSVAGFRNSVAGTYNDVSPNGGIEFNSRYTGNPNADWSSARIKWGYADTYANGGDRFGIDVINAAGGWMNALTINGGSGNIGIGATSIYAKLTIKDGTNKDLLITGNNYGSSNGMGIASVNDTNGAFQDLSLAGSNIILNATGTTANVGIGITSPLYKLHVTGDQYVSGRTSIGLGVGATNPLYALNVGGTALFSNLFTTGNVGIGTSVPGYKLEVKTAANYNLAVYNGAGVGTSYTSIASVNDTHAAYTNLALNGSNLFLNNETGGNVGIGTTSPTYKLSIANGSSNLQLLSSNNASNSFLAIGRTGDEFSQGIAGIAGNGLTDASVGDIWLRAIQPSAKLLLGAGSTVSTIAITGGRVGIGTTNPLSLLYIKSAAGIQSQLTIDSTDSSGVNSIASLLLRDAGTVKWDLRNNGGSMSDRFGIYNTTSEVFSLLQNGNLGLGITNTNNALDIGTTGGIHITTGTPASTAMALYNNAGTLTWNGVALATGGGSISGTTNYISKYTSGSTLGNSIIYDTGAGVGIGVTATTGIFQVNIGNTQALFIGSSGFLGVGTSNPGVKLEVSGNAIRVTNTAANSYVQQSAASGSQNWDSLAVGLPTYFRVSNASAADTTAMTILGTGNIGINTVSPNYKLDVAGVANFAQVGIGGTSPLFLLNVGGTAQFNNLSTLGFVGIGTTNLGNAKLTVQTGVTADGIDIGNRGAGATDSFVYIGIGLSTAGIPSYGMIGANNSANSAATNLVFQGTAFGGNVGIGTTNPLYKLTVNGDQFISGRSTIGLGTTNPLYALNVGGTANFVNLVTSGFVGVGTSNPTVKLQIQGTGTLLMLSDIGNTGRFALNLDNGTLPTFYDAFDGTWRPSLTLRMGNVGIGTTNPLAKLDVLNASGVGLSFAAQFQNLNNAVNNNGVNINIAAGDTNSYVLNASSAGTSKFMVRANGNVGIGTTNPGAKLEVVASALISGASNSFLAIGNTLGANKGFYLQNSQNPFSVGTSFGGLSVYSADSANPGMVSINPVGTNDITKWTLFNSNGSVGIGGTTALNSKLSVIGTGATAGIYLNSAIPGTTAYNLYNNAGTLMWNGIALATGGGSISGLTNYMSKFTTNTTLGNSLLADSGTGIGLGTTAPTGIFQVKVGNTEALFVSNSGFIGLGTTNPLYAFYVTGNEYISGNSSIGLGTGATNPLFTLNVGGTANFNTITALNASSTALVTNLNANLLNGYAFNALPYLAQLSYDNGIIGVGNTIRFGGSLSVGASLSQNGNALTFFGGNFSVGTTATNSPFQIAIGTTQAFFLDSSGNIGLGSTSFTVGNREKLLVDAGITNSINLFTGKGSINNYLQLNVQNLSNGSSASSDFVATADNGSETTNYINMGINGSNYSNGFVGSANDAYLYGAGNNLLIANTTAGKDILFLTSGGATSNEKMRLTGTGNLGIGTSNPLAKLDVRGAIYIGTTASPTDATNLLYNQGGNLFWNGSAVAVGTSTTTINGTTNTLARFTSPNTLASSLITDNGAIVGINNELTVNSGSIQLAGQAIAPGATTPGTMYYDNTSNNLFLMTGDNNYHRLSLDMTKYSVGGTAVANGSYIEIAHNQNTTDINSAAWFYNTITAQWENADKQAITVLQNLQNQFDNVPADNKSRTQTALTNISLTQNAYTGNGADGSITVNGNTDINTTSLIAGRSCADGGDAVNYSVTALTPNTATVESSPSTGCLNPGDEVLLINLRGTYTNMDNVGNWETLRVAGVSGSTITFTTAKTRYYGDGMNSNDNNIGLGAGNQTVMLQRVPNYTNVTVNPGFSFYPDAWVQPSGSVNNGAGEGGVIFFRANGTVTVTGTITANGYGYYGGTQSGVTQPTANSAGDGAAGGEAFCGSGGTGESGLTPATSGAGGGGGGNAGLPGNGFCGGGGGGGASGGNGSLGRGGAGGGAGGPAGDDGIGGGGGAGYGDIGYAGVTYSGSAPTNGGYNSSGRGGSSYGAGGGGGTYGDPNLNQLFFGSGGGRGGPYTGSGAGGNGGGIIYIAGNSVTASSGTISSNGVAGGSVAGTAYWSGGGGGAGGAIKIIGNIVNLGANKVLAVGGSGGTGYDAGGNAGPGRIAVQYVTAISGSSNPSAVAALSGYNTYGTYTSSVIATPNAANLGNLKWDATLNTYGKVAFQTRTGNTPDPSGNVWYKLDNTISQNMDSGTVPAVGNGRLGLGSAGKGDSIQVNKPSVILDGGIYKMWYSAYDGTNLRIYYATSVDGLTWTKVDNSVPGTCDSTGSCSYGGGRLGLGTAGKGDSTYVFNPSVIKDGSTYRMWYSGSDGTNYRIFSATSSDGLTWTKTNNTIPATSNTAGDFGRIPLGVGVTTGDTVGAYSPAVIKDGSTYKMWYSGQDSSNVRIYQATSTDAANWTKTSDLTPSNSDVSGINGQIPLGNTGKGDTVYTGTPSVIKDGSTYKMWYSGYDGTNWRIYAATSTDGQTWTKIDNSIPNPSDTAGTNGRIPISSNASNADNLSATSPSVIRDGSQYRMWYVANNSTGYRISYAYQYPDNSSWESWKPYTVGTNQTMLESAANYTNWTGTNMTVATGDVTRTVFNFEDENELNPNNMTKLTSATNGGYAEATIPATDISGYDYITFWVRGSQPGNTVTIGLGQSAATEQTENVTIDTANVWQKVYWDISDIPAAQKVGITKLRVTNISTLTNTIYFDNIRAESLIDVNNTPITSTPQNYLQYRAVFTTTNTNYMPQLNNVTFTYNNGFKIVQSDANHVRLYNFSGSAQSIKLEATVYGADLAEWYSVNDSSIQAGDVVAITGNKDDYNVPIVAKANIPGDKHLMGIISTKAGQELGIQTDDRRLVALSGRVPVKVAPDSDAISPGDLLTASKTHPGMATKASKAGFTVAKALDTWTPGSQAGLIDAFINISWFDPEVHSNDDGQITIDHNINSAVLASLGYTNSLNELQSANYNLVDSLGQQITTTGQFASATVGKFQAGLIQASSIITQNLIAETTKTKTLSTAVITPLSDITDTVAIDGNASISGTLTAQNASIAGTISANDVLIKNTSITDVMASKINDLRTELQSVIASAAKQSTSSADLTGSALMAQSSDWETTASTDSAQIDPTTKLTNNLVVGSQLTVNGNTTLGNAFITGTFTTGEIAIQDNFIETVNSALYIQPSNTGSVHLMGDTLVIAENGDVTVNGNLQVTGKFTANMLVASDIQSSTANIIDLTTTKLNIATDSATIIAQPGFAQLATSSAKMTSNATAGSATLPAGKTELVINNKNIGPNSIIYLTPAGSTGNQVVYLKSKFISPTPSPIPTVSTDSAEASSSATPKLDSNFTIAIDKPLYQDISINWWIIN